MTAPRSTPGSRWLKVQSPMRMWVTLYWQSDMQKKKSQPYNPLNNTQGPRILWQRFIL